MIAELNKILKGIDQDCCNGKDGWWETSCGAEFGAKKLKEVQDLVKKLTLSGVSGSFSQNDMENFAAKCMILGSNSKDIKELLKGFCDNDH